MSLQDFAYIGTGIVGIASVIGLPVAIWQLFNLNKSAKHSDLMSMFTIEFELNRRKERVSDSMRETFNVIAGKSILSKEEKELVKSLDTLTEESYENYLNLFDRLSYFILKNKFEEESFRLDYRDVLFSTIENDKETFSFTTRYRNMLELYNRWKEK